MTEMIGEFWQVIAFILFVTSISSFMHPKLGLIVSSLITMGSVILATLAATAAAVGADNFFVMAIVVFPVISWAGFIIGKVFRKNRNI